MNLFKRICNKLYREIDSRILSKVSDKNNKLLNLYDRYAYDGVLGAMDFNFEAIKDKTLKYIQSMKIGNDIYSYKYSASTTSANLYSSVFALMILSLYGETNKLLDSEKSQWIEYFNSFQDEKDGLFRDPVLRNDIFDSADWWGAKHLTQTILAGYHILGGKPKYPLTIIRDFYDLDYLDRWLKERDWHNERSIEGIAFVGNEIMNIGVFLQYSRDYFNDSSAQKAMDRLFNELAGFINPKTGLWGNHSIDTCFDLSQSVQGAYHLYCLYFYDHEEILFPEKVIDNCLKTQNRLGGYGEKLNSSACEDIDSIYTLINLTKVNNYREDDVRKSLMRAFPWIMSNFNSDGGFVFRRNEEFLYGHLEMFSKANESSMFATWFRTLCLGYWYNHLSGTNIYSINHVPGCEQSV